MVKHTSWCCETDNRSWRFTFETSTPLSLTDVHSDFNFISDILQSYTFGSLPNYWDMDHQLDIDHQLQTDNPTHPAAPKKRQSTSHSMLLADRRCPRLARATVSCANSSLVKGLQMPRRRRLWWWWKQESFPKIWKKELDHHVWIFDLYEPWKEIFGY